jgi:hypothetical protein
MPRTILAAVAALGLAACAPDPNTVAPAYISPTAYAGLSCAALNGEAQRINARVAQVAGQQAQAASNDAAMTAVTLILFWPAAFMLGSGDQSAELARLRGEAEALRMAALQKGC